ncbi:FUN14 domain-containing protein [Halomarina ordinaria]|uniref:FUN14 domain-containing protein n=1 Tax=Halomarina ordinaria TaxID=3033939 RepID=A0ABD5U7Y5_9EURY|nr:FUN14 domain-containing protein [Halomarina sp. PSRA2]
MSVELNAAQLGLDVGTGGVVGAVTGFAAKKLTKLVAVLVGVQLALFKYLESQQLLVVDWDRLTAGLLDVGDVAASGAPPSWVTSLLSTASVSGGFAAGFLVGFKAG